MTVYRGDCYATWELTRELDERPDGVRNALGALRERGFIDVIPVGTLEGATTRAASYWQLTDKGREELAKTR